MQYRTFAAAILATMVFEGIAEEVNQRTQQLLEEYLEKFKEHSLRFLLNQVTPFSTLEFEEKLQEELRELGREILEETFNQIEPDDPQSAPHFVHFEAGPYRRSNEKSKHRGQVGTCFGPIDLWRYRYSYRHRQAGEPAIFPLELQLGLIHGATPALAKRMGQYMAEAGANQDHVLERLRQEHGIYWGANRLRNVIESLSEKMEAMREQMQVAEVLRLLHQAYASKGRHRPVLSVGRDGITMRLVGEGNKVASIATISVYDRRGNRLGTVYIGCPPEEGQNALSRKLTSLIQRILKGWTKALPRLCYVTDEGDHENGYYHKVLRKMRNPHRPSERLEWRRVVDYYHVTTRIYTMAKAILGESVWSDLWAEGLCRKLLEPNGASRVLHAAAAMRSHNGLRSGWEEKYELAYNYIRNRTKYMRYAEYRRLGLPLGSGVTEAGCKTVFTQRLKLSGMKWKRASAEWIITLRAILLSGIWDETFAATMQAAAPRIWVTPDLNNPSGAAQAA